MSNLNIDKARYNMIEQQVRTWEVLDRRVLDVMAETRREDFVPEAWKNLAFADIEIPIGSGQVMMPPKLEGRLLQVLQIKPTDRVLEIGTGSGYLTACLARLGESVVSVELYPELSEAARRKLSATGINNVTLRTGNAADGWDQDGPFDVVAITGSLPQENPRFARLLRNAGRLFVIVGERPVMTATLITRNSDRDFHAEHLFETCIPALEKISAGRKFVF